MKILKVLLIISMISLLIAIVMTSVLCWDSISHGMGFSHYYPYDLICATLLIACYVIYDKFFRKDD